MSGVPQAAIDAAGIPDELVAAAVRADYEANFSDGRSYHPVADHQVRRLIAGAVAAERERIAREIDPDMVDLLAGWMTRTGARWLVDGRNRLLPEDVQHWARVLRGGTGA